MADQRDSWYFPINWAAGFRETVQFCTEIIVSRDGTEQRIAQRQKPRLAYEFNHLLTGEDFVEAMLRTSQRQGERKHFRHPQYKTVTASDVVTPQPSGLRRYSLVLSLPNSPTILNGVRLSTIKKAAISVLEYLREYRQLDGAINVTIGVTKWGSVAQSEFYQDATDSELASLIDFVNTLDGSDEGPVDYGTAAQAANDIFTVGVGETMTRRAWVFLVDSAHTAGLIDDAVAIAADMLDRTTGIFDESSGGRGTDVECHAVTLDYTDVVDVPLFDNTPIDEVPFIADGGHEELADVTLSAMLGLYFTLENTPSWVERGSYFFFEREDKKFELARFSFVGANSVAIYVHPFRSYDAGTPIHRAVTGFFDDASRMLFRTSGVVRPRIRFRADAVKTWHPDYGPAVTTFNSKERLVMPHNWVDGLTSPIVQSFESIDYGRGPFVRFFPISETTRTIRFSFLLYQQEHFDAVVGLFYRCSGRQKSFYVTVPTSDFRITKLEDTRAIVYPEPTHKLQYEDQNTYKYMEFVTTQYTHISEVSLYSLTSSDNTAVNLADRVPSDVTAEQVIRINWLCLVRFESDSLTINWRSGSVAEVDFSVRTLPDP